MPTLLIYGFMALAIISGIGYGVHSVKRWGADEVRAEWAAATLKAKSEAEAERQRQDALRQEQDKQATKRLADEKKRTAGLMVSLDAHIKAAGKSATVPVPDGLRDDWNRANAGPEGISTGTMPTGSAKPPHAR